MSLKRLTRENLEQIFKNSAYTLEQKHKIVTEELRLAVPPDADGDVLVDLVWEAYQKGLSEIENKKEEFKGKTIPERTTINMPTVSKDGSSKKDVIINLIKAHPGEYDLKSLVEIMDINGGYAQQGRSSRTRVHRVVKDLTAAGAIETNANGKIIIRGA